MMKGKLLIVFICCFSILVSCAEQFQAGQKYLSGMMAEKEPLPVIGKEENKTVVRLGDAKYFVPAGFVVVDVVENTPVGTYDESLVILGKPENDNYTVIMLTMHQATTGNEFVRTDLKENYAAAVFIDSDLGFVDDAVGYVARMPMARRLFLEKPVCKVVSGYKYIKKSTKYRFDIYQNIQDQDPLHLVPDRKKPAGPEKGIEPQTLEKGKQELKVFRSLAFALIRDNIRWP
jgi:hypothetical protein